MSKGKTSDGYNQNFDYQDAADNAKADLDIAMEQGARDKSFENDPRNRAASVHREHRSPMVKTND